MLLVQGILTRISAADEGLCFGIPSHVAPRNFLPQKRGRLLPVESLLSGNVKVIRSLQHALPLSATEAG